MTIPGSANPLLLASAAAGGYAIERSVRFNSADSAYLSRTPSTAGNRKTWTWAGWVKRGALGVVQQIFASRPTVSPYSLFYFFTDNKLAFDNGISSFSTNAVFRDSSAWYHIVFWWDSTQATEANRIKLYVNGVEQTFASASYPTQNADGQINTATNHTIGKGGNYTNEHFNGLLTDIHFIDGQALDPTSFGEFDDNGIWQPIAYSGSYGTNGFHLPFDDNSTAAALGTDTSGNGNDWTVNNLFTRSVKTLPAVAFDGSGDYLSLADSTDWSFGSGDFTIEAFVYGNSFGSYEGIVGQWPQADGNTANSFVLEAVGGDLEFFYSVGTTLYGPIQGATLTPKKWHHVAAVRSGNTMYMFVDGVMYGSGSSVTHTFNDAASPLTVGGNIASAGMWNGFISNVRVIKGTALYTSNFTPPSAPLTAVTNTKLLCCQSSTSATAATVSPGTITANGDVFATTRSDSSSSEDSLVDVPTNGTETDTGVGGEVRGNYATLNPLDNGGGTLTNGNLDASYPSHKVTRATLGMSTGKWYWEVLPDGTSLLGIATAQASLNSFLGSDVYGWGIYSNGEKFNGSGGVAYGASFTSGDTIGVALDLDAGTLVFYKNGVSQGTAFTGLVNGPYFPAIGHNAMDASINFGQRPFAYTAPSGFKALCTANLPAPLVTKPSTVMDVALYTGNGSTQNITGLGFNPDLVWMKVRNYIYWNELVDSVRGVGKSLFSNAADAEGTINTLTAFNADGFTVSTNSGTYNGTNENGRPYVAWTWDAGSSTVTNTDGSITSSVRANPSAGFSIVTWTPQATAGTVGHGLGVAPAMIITKDRDTANGWFTYHSALGATKYLVLNLTNAVTTNSTVFSTAPTSTVFDQGTGFTSTNGYGRQVCYCFAPVAGYSAFGSYVGNGSADGSFVYTGFRPRWIMVKSSSYSNNTIAYSWCVFDTQRNTSNVMTSLLLPNASDSEYTVSAIDALSNGFKLRDTNSSRNQSGVTYVWAAFAESPFQYARAR